MRTVRLLGEGRSFYHCMSRVVDRRFIFEDAEKDYFLGLMRKLEAFLGVRVVTYCLMSNHFHLLLDVPDPEEVAAMTAGWSDEDLLERLSLLYSEEYVAEIRNELNRLRFVDPKTGALGAGNEAHIERIRRRYLDRMGSMACFMQSLKQRFSSWYNRLNARRGTLWEDRYKSVLVEGSRDALSTMAAYIDLNPVRARLVKDPKDYRWCGYGEAVVGGELARASLAVLLEFGGEYVDHEDIRAGRVWKKVGSAYRLVLYGVGEERRGIDDAGGAIREGFSREEAIKVWEAGGHLSTAEVLRCRVRYFVDGVAIGSRYFVDDLFQRNRKCFGPKRKSGARKMKGAEWPDLTSMRDLRKEVVA